MNYDIAIYIGRGLYNLDRLRLRLVWKAKQCIRDCENRGGMNREIREKNADAKKYEDETAPNSKPPPTPALERRGSPESPACK